MKPDPCLSAAAKFLIASLPPACVCCVDLQPFFFFLHACISKRIGTKQISFWASCHFHTCARPSVRLSVLCSLFLFKAQGQIMKRVRTACMRCAWAGRDDTFNRHYWPVGARVMALALAWRLAVRSESPSSGRRRIVVPLPSHPPS